MKEHVFRYYTGEFYLALAGSVIGLVLLLLTGLLWDSGYSLNRGLSLVFLGGGAVFTIVFAVIARQHKQKIKEIDHVRTLNDRAMKRAEVSRLEDRMDYSYMGALIVLSVAVIIGLILSIASWDQLVLKGIGFGLLIVGSLGYVTEAISMKRSLAYLKEIKKLHF